MLIWESSKLKILPYSFPLIILLTVWTEPREEVQTTEEAGSETEGEGWHQQPVDSLLSKLSL